MPASSRAYLVPITRVINMGYPHVRRRIAEEGTQPYAGLARTIRPRYVIYYALRTDPTVCSASAGGSSRCTGGLFDLAFWITQPERLGAGVTHVCRVLRVIEPVQCVNLFAPRWPNGLGHEMPIQ